MLISDEYRSLNRTMHDSKPSYGTSGAHHKELIVRLIDRSGSETILDYGCGKGNLKRSLPPWLDIREYDPAIPGKDTPPLPADLVVCTDVLEHVEPDCLDRVMDDLRGLTRKAVFLSVHTGPALKHLPDGRNAHLIQQPYSWWLPRIWSRWRVEVFNNGERGFIVIGTPA